MLRYNLREQLISVVKMFSIWGSRLRWDCNSKLDLREVRYESAGNVFSWLRIEPSGEIL
jgi:hypothetical protein